MIKKVITLFVLISIIFVGSCKKADGLNEPEEQIPSKEIVISEYALPIDDEIRNSIKMTDSSFTFSLPAKLIASKKIDVNDVLVEKSTSEFPYGYLRKITAVTINGDNVVIKTSQATLKDVIKQGTIKLTKYKLNKNNLATIKSADGVTVFENKTLAKNNMIGIDWNYNKILHSSGNGKVEVNGSFAFDCDFNFELSVDLLDVEYFKTSVEVNQSVSLNYKSNVTKKISAIKVPFQTFRFTPVTVMAGVIPIVLFPEVTLYLGADGQVSAESEGWFRESFTGEYGIEYKENRGWNVINSDNFKLEKEFPKVTGAGKFKFFAGPEAGIKLYGVAGPYLTFDGYSEIEGTTDNNKLDYNLVIGFESVAGVKVELFGWDLLNVNKPVFSKELFRFNSKEGTIGDNIKITNPSASQEIIKGDLLKITTYCSGNKPVKVKFIIDDVEKAEINKEPFEWTLATENMTEGNHTIKVKAVYADKTIDAAPVSFKLVQTKWTKADLGNLIKDDEDIHKVYFVNENLGFLTGGGINSSFILKTTNGGNSWQKVFAGLKTVEDRPVTDIVYISSSELYAITENYLYRSMDNGSGWAPYTPKGEIYSRLGGSKMAISSDGLIITSYNSSFFIKTAESNGDVWREFPTEGSRGNAYAVKYIGGKRVVVLDSVDPNKVQPHQYLISDDGGLNWTVKKLNIPMNWEPKDMDFINSKEGWIAGKNVFNDRGFLLKTDDGGNSWYILIDGNSETLFPLWAVDFIDYSYGFTAGELVDLDMNGVSWHQGILSSNNGGKNWSNKSLNDYNKNFAKILSFHFFSKTRGWAAGASKSLYKYGTN